MTFEVIQALLLRYGVDRFMIVAHASEARIEVYSRAVPQAAKDEIEQHRPVYVLLEYVNVGEEIFTP